MVTETFISCELPCVGINTKLNAKLALRQRADLFEANISNIENISLKSISPLPYCQPCIQCVIIPTQSSERYDKKEPVGFIYALSGPLHSKVFSTLMCILLHGGRIKTL